MHAPSNFECVRQDRAGRVRPGPAQTAASSWCRRAAPRARSLTPGCRSRSVSDVTGFPEMMDGRVKTLHPKIHGGILARRAHAEDLAAAARARHRARRSRVRQPLPVRADRRDSRASRFDDLIEQIDIGGPSLVRAAAKNFQRRAGRGQPGRLRRCARRARSRRRPDDRRSASTWRAAAFAHTGAYDSAIAVDAGRSPRRRRRVRAQRAGGDGWRPTRLVDRGAQASRSALRRESAPAGGVVRARSAGWRWAPPSILQGKELSFTNLLDLDAAARIVLEFDEPAACVIKHTNPCGAATGDAHRRGVHAGARCRRAGGLRRHRRAQPSDRRGDGPRDRLDVHRSRGRARGRLRGRRAILQAKANMRVVTGRLCTALGGGGHTREVRSILGALLVQQRDEVVEARQPWPAEGLKVVTSGSRRPRNGRRCVSPGG